MTRRKSTVAKAEPNPEADKVFRLTDIEPEFVSLVRAGANRQRSFMVVKADEAGLGPGGVCVCVDCGHETTHETGVKCNEMKCDKCGGTMTRKDTKGNHDTTPAEAPVVDDGKGAEGHQGSGNKSDGNETPPKDATDLASWLNEATEQVEELSLDIAIQRALDAHAADKAAPGQAPEEPAQEIGKTAAPAVTEDDGAGDREKTARLEVELAKARRENVALKAKAARLAAAAVGKSSVILTGEVTRKDTKADRKPQQSPSRGAFNRGGDIAAAIARRDDNRTGDGK